MNTYIVRSYGSLIVVTNGVRLKTIEANIIAMHYKYKNAHISKIK